MIFRFFFLCQIFLLRSNISSGQILSCEYTVHPRWLADNNDAAALWPSNLPKPTSQDEMELVQDEVVIEEPAPIDFDRWCEEQETEEPANCNDIIFEQDIPASLEEEVITNSNDDTELDENSDNCSQSSQQIEERSNRSPDVYVPNSINSCDSCAVDGDEKPMVKFKQTLLVNKTLLKLNQRKLTINPKAGTSILKSNILDKSVEQNAPVKGESVAVQSEPKFNQSLVIKRISPISKYQKSTKFTIKKIKSRPFGGGKGKTGGKNAHNNCSGGGKTKKFVDLHGENITINHEADECIDTDDDIKPVVPPITIKKEQLCSDSESDIEVDIETDTPNDLIESHQLSSSAISPAMKSEPEPVELRKVPPLKIKTLKRREFVQPTQVETMPLSPELQQILDSLELPKEELVLLPQNITEIEKYFHPEFFVGRPTKTPERYLKIRDFIIHVWNDLKPAYVSKTTVRNGLKHCGDVNCISRIHCMLEQIGTINIGQSGEHFQYIRPLSKLKEHFMQSAQNKKTQSTSTNYDVTTVVMGRRQRNKSITFSSSEKEIDANYTVSHINGVPQLVYAAMSKEREHPRREASKPLKIEFELIECLRFAKDKIPPFKISMSLSTLLCLYLHALSSKYEVMGFLGGYCSKSCGRNKLSLTRYKPTKTASQTGTTCEMCPGMFYINNN